MEKTKGKALSTKVKKRKKVIKMIEVWNGMGEVLAYCMEGQEDKTFSIVRHSLNPGKVIKPHYHKIANEFIIMKPVVLRLRLMEKQQMLLCILVIYASFFYPRKKFILLRRFLLFRIMS